MDETGFRLALGNDGFNEVLTRDMPPDAVLPEHTHPWDARLLVLQGEMRLERDGGSLRLCSGDHCEIAQGVPHAEYYGPQGTSLLIGRRYPISPS
jgi:quercetin dioxygenase-like cupin family protein